MTYLVALPEKLFTIYRTNTKEIMPKLYHTVAYRVTLELDTIHWQLQKKHKSCRFCV